ncbi:MAG TPA: sulfotransferase [Xanthobacteraceae bacterium]|nr:sulfotransferase [Xanthobacteraceae bacterium]
MVSPPGCAAEREAVAAPSLAQPNGERHHTAITGTADTIPDLCNKAFAHHRDGRFAEAIALYRQILSLKPDLPEIYNNFGHALAALGKPDAAILAFECAVALKPDNPQALCNWGLALAELDRFDEADAKYRQALAVDPGFAGAYNNIGLLHKARGRLPEAAAAFEQAIGLAPRDPSFYDNLAAVKTFSAGDPYLTALEALAQEASANDQAGLSSADQIHLNFALAKAYEQTGRPQEAFRHLRNGNALKRREMNYDETATLGEMDRLRELIGGEFIRARQDFGEPSRLPIFIVGMTRSGTTLIEQILASHPQVFGAGELDVLDKAAGSLRGALPGSPPFPDMMLQMSAEQFRALGAGYVAQISERASAAARITDKMPENFLFAGLIHLALPDATIIHAVRNPIDTCVSCFATDFTKGHPHTYDLAELGRYYRHYRTLMAHWDAVLPPGRILEVRYEELIADVEGTARRIVSHCGLPWDESCLDFHRTERLVHTASAAQVRKPIYGSSVGRRHKYAAFLEPLLRELGPFAV